MSATRDATIRGEIAREWNGHLARRPYFQVIPNTTLRPHGSMNYNSLQTKVERRFSGGLALSMGLHLVQGHELQRHLGRLVRVARL